MRKRTGMFLKQGLAVMTSLSLAFGPCAPGIRPVFGAQTEAVIDEAEEEDSVADGAAEEAVSGQPKTASASDAFSKAADVKASDSDALVDEDGFLIDGEIANDFATGSNARKAGLLRTAPPFFFETEVDGYHITMRAPEDVLPEGTEVRIEQITVIDGEVIEELINRELERPKAVKSIVTFDISFLCDEEEIQPEAGKVSVTVRLPEEVRKDQTEAADESSEMKVFHLEGLIILV